MKQINKRNGTVELFDTAKIEKSIDLAYQAIDIFYRETYIAYYTVVKDAVQNQSLFDAKAEELNELKTKVLAELSDNALIKTTKDVSKNIILFYADKISPEKWWIDTIALSLLLQDINHEVNGKFNINSYTEALENCAYRNIPYAGMLTIKSRYLEKTSKNVLKEELNDQTFCVKSQDNNHFYELIIRRGEFLHSTPTLLNYRKPIGKNQLSSCTQVGIEDTTESVTEAINAVAQYSRHAAGLGLHISKIRERGAPIAGKTSAGGGVVSLCKIFESTIGHFDQQGQRGGALAAYLHILHPDIIDFLNSQELGGQEDQRLHKLQLGVVIPDIFMQAVIDDEYVYLISPTTGLYELAGADFNEKYRELVTQGKYKRKIKAIAIFINLIKNQRARSLFPFFIDNVYRGTGEVHLGSNLCTEMLLRTDKTYDGICNLGSINVYQIIKNLLKNPKDREASIFGSIRTVAQVATQKLLDITQLTYVPTSKGHDFNYDIPTVGLGVMGMAQAIDLMQQCRPSLNYAQMQSALLKAVNEGAKKGGTYWSMINQKKHGRLLTIAPTESISVIGGCTSAAEFPISTMFIKGINKMDTKVAYPFYKGRLAYEVPIKEQIDLAVERQKYLDHSQSINLFITDKKFKQGIESMRQRIISIKESNDNLTTKQTDILEAEGIINDLLKDADISISQQQAQAFLQAWENGLYTLYYLRLEDTKHVTACESCAG